jgi:hypothetical protein
MPSQGGRVYPPAQIFQQDGPAKLGISFLFKYVTRQLVIEDLIQRFRVLFGVEARAIVTSYAEIGTDLDKVTDLVFFQEQLGTSKNIIIL